LADEILDLFGGVPAGADAHGIGSSDERGPLAG
jgi:hypothetical protein